MSHLRIAVLPLVLVACYPPPPAKPPRVELPALQAGAEVEVHTESTTKIEEVRKKSVTCPPHESEGSPNCSVTYFPMVEPVTHTKTEMTYAGKPLDHGQLVTLADGEYDAKLAKVDELSATCKKARVPRTVGLWGTLGGLALWGIAAGTRVAAFTYAGAGALAVGTGAFAYGYFGAGGGACGEANQLANELAARASDHEVIVRGADEAVEIQRLADQFNARMQAQARAQPEGRETR